MFSIITIASSTTKPVEIVSAIKVRLLRLKPSRYITPNVPMSDSGTATLGIIVARKFRRNKKIAMTTSAIVSMSENSTSRTEPRIVIVRSVITETSMPAGKFALSCGNSFLIRSTTSIVFTPGWR